MCFLHSRSPATKVTLGHKRTEDMDAVITETLYPFLESSAGSLFLCVTACVVSHGLSTLAVPWHGLCRTVQNYKVRMNPSTDALLEIFSVVCTSCNKRSHWVVRTCHSFTIITKLEICRHILVKICSIKFHEKPTPLE